MLKRIGSFSFVFLVMFSLSGLFAGGSAESDAAGTSEASDAAVVITHPYGETVLSSVPEKVVSVGYGEHETVLALGVVPVAVRDWHAGDMPYATGPWVSQKLRDELSEADPVVLSVEMDFEAIAALNPDVIVGIFSGMTKEEYDFLSQIAPTIPRPGKENRIPWGTPWQVQTRILGQVLGKTEEAEKLISGIENSMDSIKARNPEFVGATAAVVEVKNLTETIVLPAQHRRTQLVQQLGFVIPPEYRELAGDHKYLFISEERLDLLDTDVLLWQGFSDEVLQNARDFPLRDTMPVNVEGRELFVSKIYTRALAVGSPPSITFFLDLLASGLAAAVDGNPATLVPESLR